MKITYWPVPMTFMHTCILLCACGLHDYNLLLSLQHIAQIHSYLTCVRTQNASGLFVPLAFVWQAFLCTSLTLKVHFYAILIPVFIATKHKRTYHKHTTYTRIRTHLLSVAINDVIKMGQSAQQKVKGNISKRVAY